MQMQFDSPVFVKVDLLDAVGPNAGPVHMWLSQGLITPTVRSAGTGQPHLYNALDVARVAAIQSLVAQGVDVSDAARIVRKVSAEPSSLGSRYWSDLVRSVADDTDQREFWILVARHEGEPDICHTFHEEGTKNLLELIRLLRRGGGRGVWCDCEQDAGDGPDQDDYYRVTPYPIGPDLRRALKKLAALYSRKVAR